MSSQLGSPIQRLSAIIQIGGWAGWSLAWSSQDGWAGGKSGHRRRRLARAGDE